MSAHIFTGPYDAAVDIVLPNPSTSRVFIKRTYEEYAAMCSTRGLPTRLVVGCGHLEHTPTGDGCCLGHSSDYFTLNISYSRNSDILGDVFRMENQAFKPNSWDFIIFENFPWYNEVGGQRLWNFNDKNLRMIANSLRPNGAWVLADSQSRFSHVIKIGDDDFGGGDLTITEMQPGIFHKICIESQKMQSEATSSAFGGSKFHFGDLAVFQDNADVITTVNNFFIRFGFRKADIQTLPAFFMKSLSVLTSMFGDIPTALELEDRETKEKLTLNLDQWTFSRISFNAVSRLTGERVRVDSRNTALSFGDEIDALAGREWLEQMHDDVWEFPIIVRK